jgi:hypothetical protein
MTAINLEQQTQKAPLREGLFVIVTLNQAGINR